MIRKFSLYLCFILILGLINIQPINVQAQEIPTLGTYLSNTTPSGIQATPPSSIQTQEIPTLVAQLNITTPSAIQPSTPIVSDSTIQPWIMPRNTIGPIYTNLTITGANFPPNPIIEIAMGNWSTNELRQWWFNPPEDFIVTAGASAVTLSWGFDFDNELFAYFPGLNTADVYFWITLPDGRRFSNVGRFESVTRGQVNANNASMNVNLTFSPFLATSGVLPSATVGGRTSAHLPIGSQISLTANIPSGQFVSGWSTSPNLGNFGSQNSIQFTMPTTNTSVTANFGTYRTNFSSTAPAANNQSTITLAPNTNAPTRTATVSQPNVNRIRTVTFNLNNDRFQNTTFTPTMPATWNFIPNSLSISGSTVSFQMRQSATVQTINLNPAAPINSSQNATITSFPVLPTGATGGITYTRTLNGDLHTFTIQPNPADPHLTLNTNINIQPIAGWVFFNPRMSGTNLLVDARQNSQLQSLELINTPNWTAINPNPATYSISTVATETATQPTLTLGISAPGHNFPQNITATNIILPNFWEHRLQPQFVSNQTVRVFPRYVELISNVRLEYTPTDGLDYQTNPNLWQVTGSGEFNTPYIEVRFLGETINNQHQVQLTAPEWFRFPATFSVNSSIGHLNNLQGRQGGTPREAFVSFNIDHSLDFTLPEVEDAIIVYPLPPLLEIEPPILAPPMHPNLPEVEPPIQTPDQTLPEVKPPIQTPDQTLPEVEPPIQTPDQPILALPPNFAPPPAAEVEEKEEEEEYVYDNEPPTAQPPISPSQPERESPAIQQLSLTQPISLHETDGETQTRATQNQSKRISYRFDVDFNGKIVTQSMVARVEVFCGEHKAQVARFRVRQGNPEVFGIWGDLPNTEENVLIRVFLNDGRIFYGISEYLSEVKVEMLEE